MVCPLLLAAGPKTTGFSNPDCIKDRCAWWDDGDSVCAILYLRTLLTISNHMEK